MTEIRETQKNDNAKMSQAQRTLLANTLTLLTKYCVKYNDLAEAMVLADAYRDNTYQAQSTLKDKMIDPELDSFSFLKNKLTKKYNNPTAEKSIKKVNCN